MRLVKHVHDDRDRADKPKGQAKYCKIVQELLPHSARFSRPPLAQVTIPRSCTLRGQMVVRKETRETTTSNHFPPHS